MERYNVDRVGDPSGTLSPFDVHLLFYGDEEVGKVGARADIPEDSLLLRVVENCLDSSLWENEDGEPLDIASLRSHIYEKVVSLLEIH